MFNFFTGFITFVFSPSSAPPCTVLLFFKYFFCWGQARWKIYTQNTVLQSTTSTGPASHLKTWWCLAMLVQRFFVFVLKTEQKWDPCYLSLRKIAIGNVHVMEINAKTTGFYTGQISFVGRAFFCLQMEEIELQARTTTTIWRSFHHAI